MQQSTPTPSVAQVFEKARKFSSKSTKAKGITQRIMEFIALDDQPSSVVEDFGFCRLIDYIEPCYAMPSRRQFSDVCLPKLYSLVATHITELLASDIPAIGFTTDIWSSDVSPTSDDVLIHYVVKLNTVSTQNSSYKRFCCIHKSLEDHTQQQPFLMHSPICLTPGVSTDLKCMT